MTIKEKVAYLQGLLSGLELDESSKEVKVIKAIVDVLNDMAMIVTDTEDELEELNDRVDEIDEDLGEVEEEVFGGCDCDCDDDCDCCDEDDTFYEVTCPTCGKEICLTESILDEGGIECPNCGEALEFDLDDDMEDGHDGSCADGSCDCGDKE